MQTCPHCGKQNPDNDAYCYACGHILPSALRDVIKETTRLDEVYDNLEPKRRWGTAYFGQGGRLRFTFRDTNETLDLTLTTQLVVGRIHDPYSPDRADVDLAAYGAVEKGVSRRHLVLRRDHDTVMVIDQGSANHTYLNGQQLIPYEPRILRDNDELRLGRLVVRVNYE